MRYFIDYRQQWVDNMSRPGGEGEAIGDERRDDGDLFRVLADDPFRNAHQEIDPAGHFHGRRCHNNREHYEEHFAWDVRRCDVKSDDKHEQSHCPPQAESNTSSPGAHSESACEDKEFEN
jgi:hypothetical protein